MTSFRILGPVEVWNGERRLALGGPRQVRLLAALVLHANRAVSTDTLVEAVWGPERQSADNRLKMAITRLRKTLAPLEVGGESLVQTVGGGYILSIGAGALDAAVLRKAVSDGQRALDTGEPMRAAETFRAALELWRGPPLADLAFADFAQAEIRSLEELRLVALEGRIDADQQVGGDEAVVAELEALLVEQPTRERAAGQLMLALYRCSRQADALAVYQRIRSRLAQDLGLEPGPALRTLQAEILEQAASLDQPAPAAERQSPRRGAQGALEAPLPTRLEPHGVSGFVGREKEREILERAIAETAVSGRRAAFVAGEAGIGKTRLVSEIARAAHVTGTLVLGGRCDNVLDLPYQPFVEAMEHLVEHAPAAMLETHVAEYGESLARLVPALAARVRGTRPSPPAASESERYVLFRAVEGLFASVCAHGPVLLVLEDLHWAELPSLKLLRRLLTSPRPPPLMVLATCRTADLQQDHPLVELLADLHREPHVLRLELSGLNADDVVELLQGPGGTPPGADSRQLARTLTDSTNGNPFFITELVTSLAESGTIVNDSGQWGTSSRAGVTEVLPLSIAETLAGRLRRLGPAVQRCLEVASVLGEEFASELIAEVALDPAVTEALDDALKAAVLLEVPSDPARFRFTHSIMQRYLYREIGAARRPALHRQVALALESRQHTGRLPAAEIARHWLAAGESAHRHALGWALQAGDEAMAKLAPDEARRWYEIALDIVDRGTNPDEPERCDLLIKRGEAERQVGEPRFRDTLLQAAELAQVIGDPGRLVRAALANSRGMQSETGIVDEARIAVLDAALQSVRDGERPSRARLLAMRAAELMYSRDWVRRVRLSDEALAVARELGDPRVLSSVLNLRFVTLLAPETHSERRANTIEAVAAAENLSDPIARFYAYHWRGYACIEAGEVAGARSWIAREREIAERFRQPTSLWLACAQEANLAIVAGELELASQLADRALEIGRQSEPDALACHVAQQVSIAFEARCLPELIPLIQAAVAANPGVPGFRAALALALAEASRAEEAQILLNETAGSAYRDVAYDVAWLAVTCIHGYVSAELGDAATAAQLYELLKPWDAQIAFPAFGVWGPVEFYLGRLARAVGAAADAEAHLSAAAQIASRADAPLWQARVSSELTRLAAVTS